MSLTEVGLSWIVSCDLVSVQSVLNCHTNLERWPRFKMRMTV